MASQPGRTVNFTGRVLYLTEDKAQLEAQLYGNEKLPYDPARKLVDNISTDELTPGWVCYYYDETLARYCLVGLRGGTVQRETDKAGRNDPCPCGSGKKFKQCCGSPEKLN